MKHVLRRNIRGTLLDLFNQMIKEKDDIYYAYDPGKDYNLDSFDAICFDKIKQLFDAHGKEHFFDNEKVNKYYQNDENGIMRCQHAFSLYLLGIFCYKNIPMIQEAFNIFLDRLYAGYNQEIADNSEREENNYYKNFLYLWYPTALYHDMGYYYEYLSEEDEQSNYFSRIIQDGKIMDKDCFGFIDNSLGIPKQLKDISQLYFQKRLEGHFFTDKACIDHGFAGGMGLYNQMRHVHCHDNPLDMSFYLWKGFKYGTPIFKWYNTTSAWAITCHNIYMASNTTDKDKVKKYEEAGFRNIVYNKNNSFINFKEHPLLFLLDFVDSIDPVKRFGIDILNSYVIDESEENSLLLHIVDSYGNCQLDVKSILKKMNLNIGFLKSDSFRVDVDNEQDSITFSFG